MALRLKVIAHNVPGDPPPRLTEFIRQNRDDIRQEWIAFADTKMPAAAGMTRMALLDHLDDILTFIVKDIEEGQTATEQAEKSKGLKERPSERDTAPEVHARGSELTRSSDRSGASGLVPEFRSLPEALI